MGLFLLPCPLLHGFSADSWHLPGKALSLTNPTTWLFIIHNEDTGHMLEKESQVVEVEPFMASPPSLEVACSLTLLPHHTSPSSFPDNRPLAVQRRRIKLSNYKRFLFPTAGSAEVLKGLGLLLCLIPHKLLTAYNSAGQQWPTSLPRGAHLPKSFILLIPLHTGSSSG